MALIAGPPISSPRPGSVTFPTPSPARNWIPVCLLYATVALIVQPLVTSGSSPASLTTEQVAESFRTSV